MLCIASYEGFELPEIVFVASGLPFQGAFTFTPCIMCKGRFKI